jgi:hypothetical protein
MGTADQGSVSGSGSDETKATMGATMISNVTTSPTTQMYLKSFIITPVTKIELKCAAVG